MKCECQLARNISLSLAGQLAEDLLKAWISGDAMRVNTELERSFSVPVESYDVSEEEQAHLLKAVAGQDAELSGPAGVRGAGPGPDAGTVP